MKTIHQVNFGFFIFTLVLYLTIYLGLLAQVVLGVLQLSIGLYLISYKYREIPSEHQVQLKIYWVITTVYLVSLFFLNVFNFQSNTFWVLYLMIAPMAIATYFTTVLYKLQKKVVPTPSIR